MEHFPVKKKNKYLFASLSLTEFIKAFQFAALSTWWCVFCCCFLSDERKTDQGTKKILFFGFCSAFSLFLVGVPALYNPRN